MELSGLVEDLQDRIRPLKARLFPRQLLIELNDDGLRAQVLADGRPGSIRFEVPLPALTCKDGMPLEKEPIGDLIGDLMVRDNLMEAFVMAALPPAAVHWRVLEWPAGEALPEDPAEVLRERDPDNLRLPVSLSDCVIDVRPLPTHRGAVLMAASPRRVVDDWIQVFNLAGAQLERLAPAQTCELLGLQPHLAGVSSHDLIALVSPDPPDQTRLLLFRNGIPRYERRLAAQGPSLCGELARCIAFYRRVDPEARHLRLMLSRPMDLADSLGAELGVPAETLENTPFDSLVIRGLATPEPLR